MSRALIAVTQRVLTVPEQGERRDALDQCWSEFLAAAGYLPLILPNQPELAQALIANLMPQGLLLTGGNSLADYGGDAPERDACERALLAQAVTRQLPVLGVCRGMQLLLSVAGQPLTPVAGHVKSAQSIVFQGERIQVNSYHHWGCYQVPEAFTVLAQADDGVIKAVRHTSQTLMGIMWHPERLSPFRPADLSLFRQFFGGDA